MADFEGEAVVTGYGQIEGRVVYAYSQDFTITGGSLGEMHAKKIVSAQDNAAKVGAPLVGLNDSGGARMVIGDKSSLSEGALKNWLPPRRRCIYGHQIILFVLTSQDFLRSLLPSC